MAVRTYKTTEKQRAHSRNNYLKNRAAYIARSKKRYLENRDRPEFKAERDERKRLWRLANPEKVKAQWDRDNLKTRLKRRGITISDFREMKNKQSGSCAICGSVGSKGLHLDHCHSTNKVRGLLCCNCNLGIGYFKDNPALLVAAADYLIPR